MSAEPLVRAEKGQRKGNLTVRCDWTLLKSAKTGDSDALARLSRHVPTWNPTIAALHDAQLTIAREQGFASWPRFRAFIAESQLSDYGLVTKFISAATADLRQAEEILAAHPRIADAGFYVALVLGDAERVASTLTESPELVQAKSGPENCEPVVYACFSRYANPRSGRAEGIVETVRLLLNYGADPDTSTIVEDFPDNPLSVLYAASGLNNNPVLTEALLQAGANPNDGESLYHSTEHADLACTRLLLRHGAKIPGSNALRHILDGENLDGVQLLLAAGADPNETNDRAETCLHWAVWRGRSAAIVAALLDAGANTDAVRADGRTAYAITVHTGQTEIAALLESRGARTDLSPVDRLVGTGATDELARLLAESPGVVTDPVNQRLLSDLAMSHQTEAVRAAVTAGWPVDLRGEHGGTALHWACWKGYADIVEILLKHGASLSIEDQSFNGIPAGWFAHGLHNCHDPGGDYPAVARLLVAAGATIPAVDLPTGVPPVDAVLRELHVI